MNFNPATLRGFCQVSDLLPTRLFLPFEERSPQFLMKLAIVWMHVVQEICPQTLFESKSSEISPSRIEKCPVASRIALEDHFFNVFHNRLILFRALPQRLLCPTGFEETAHAPKHHWWVDGFSDKISRPRFKCPINRRLIIESSDHQHRRRIVADERFQLSAASKAIHHWHHRIQQHHIGLVLSISSQTLLSIPHLFDLISLLFYNLTKHHPRESVIVCY